MEIHQPQQTIPESEKTTITISRSLANRLAANCPKYLRKHQWYAITIVTGLELLEGTEVRSHFDEVPAIDPEVVV